MSPNSATGSLGVVAIDRLRTTYACLRPGSTQQYSPRDPVPLPLRVVPTDDGCFEVIDGFKRLAAEKERAESRELAVVLEAPAPPHEHKRLLLVANAPPRTITAIDEARVVCSLIDDDHLSVCEIARLLGKRRQWVECRLEIGRHLSVAAEQKLASGAIGPTLAQRLCAFPVYWKGLTTSDIGDYVPLIVPIATVSPSFFRAKRYAARRSDILLLIVALLIVGACQASA